MALNNYKNMKKVLYINLLISTLLCVAVILLSCRGGELRSSLSLTLAAVYFGGTLGLTIMSLMGLYNNMSQKSENVVKKIFIVLLDLLGLATVLAILNEFAGIGMWWSLLIVGINGIALVYSLIKCIR